MVGYVEDLELISVSDILNDVSLNSSASSSTLMNASSSTTAGANRTLTPITESLRFTRNSDLQGYRRQESKNVLEHENTEQSNDPALDYLSRIPNPVGYLQEMCVKSGFDMPVYGILKQEGPSHDPTFTTFCQVKEHYRVVSTNTKKKGKEMAAREIIMCLKKAIDLAPKRDSGELIDNETAICIRTEPAPENSRETSTSTRTMNYVGFLQEFCVRMHLPPPNYGTEKSTGTPNNPIFYVFCEVGPHREIGMASNKKNAKQLAADKVLRLIAIPKTANESNDKEIAYAENDEIVQTTVATKRIEILSETALETFCVIPNPVGHLQELCVKNRLRPPVYEIVKIDGPPHCPTFLTSCKVDYLYQEASSSNKKKGKELAASKILKCLKEHISASK